MSRIDRSKSQYGLRLLIWLFSSLLLVVLYSKMFNLSVLWGDDFLVVSHFSSPAESNWFFRGLSETGQGKWRPLTYTLISLGASLFGFSALWWLIVSAFTLTFLFAALNHLLESVVNIQGFRKESKSLHLFLSTSFYCQPFIWYVVGSPFSVLEAGGAGWALLSLSYFIRIFRDEFQSRSSGVALSIIFAWLAILSHERYLFLVIGLTVVTFLRIARFTEDFSIGVMARSLSNGPVLNSNSSIYVLRQNLRLLILTIPCYLLLRSVVEGSALITTGGESGTAGLFGWWLLFRPGYAVYNSVLGNYSYFGSVSGWRWSSGFFPIAELFLGFVILSALIWLIFQALSSRRKGSQDSCNRCISERENAADLLIIALFLVIPACLVRERIEVRWTAVSSLILFLLCSVLLSERIGRRSQLSGSADSKSTSNFRKVSVSSYMWILIFLATISFRVVGLWAPDPYFELHTNVSSIVEEVPNESLSQGLVIEICGFDINDVKWALGYGGVLTHYTSVENIEYEVNDYSECLGRSLDVRIMSGNRNQ